MMQAVIILCNSNLSATAGIPAFSVVLNEAQTKFDLVSHFVQIVLTGTKGITGDNYKLRMKMTLLALKCGNALLALAHVNNNQTLIAKVKYSLSKMNRLKKQDILSVCALIADEANSNLTAASAFGMSVTDVTDLLALVSEYTLWAQNPRFAIVNKMEASAQIKLLITEVVEDLFKKQMDPMVRTLLTTNPSFVRSYANAREIQDIGKKFTKLSGSVTDTNGNPLGGITINIQQTSGNSRYTATTDANGNFMISSIIAGDYDLDIKANGYQTVTEQNVHIAPGRQVGRSYQLNAA